MKIRSSFVSASAGTGKTKTLIDRLIFLLLNNISPHRILCITFTKSASLEIIHRINRQLSFLCICSDRQLEDQLKEIGFKYLTEEIKYKARKIFIEYIDSTETIKVQTIHSFCQDLLSKFPSEAGIRLGFNLIDESEVSKLLDEARHILLNKQEYRNQLKEVLQYLSWHIKEYSFNELIKEITENREKLDDYFENKFQVGEKIKLLNEDEILSKFISDIKLQEKDFEILNLGGKNDVKRASQFKKFYNYSLENKILFINEYLDCFLTQTGLPLKSIISKKLADEYPNALDVLTIEQARVYDFYNRFNQVKTYNQTNCFLVLSYNIRKIYKELKSTNNFLDYDDLIIIADNLLSNSEYADWIRYKLDGGISHVLVDEAQDNSLKQWNIINRITEEFFSGEFSDKSLFIVGDAKQSIFRFQGAAPEIFNNIGNHLPKEMNKLELNKSYRSARQILCYVDKVFNQHKFKSFLGNTEEVIQHIPTKTFEGKVEIWPLVVSNSESKNDRWVIPSEFKYQEKEDAETLLAEKITIQIKNWLEQKKFLYSKNREINPGDILILSRRRNSLVQTIIDKLHANSIPVAGLDRLKLLEHPAILDLISFSKFLLCKKDDMNLAIALKSPLFNISDEQLINLCHAREQNLWSMLESKDYYIEICNFIKKLEYDLIYKFYFNFIEENNLREKYQNIYGTEVNDIYDSFLDIVEEFENKKSPSLQSFLLSLENMSLDLKRDASEINEEVRIMTVHGAKGLQAPIVILTDTVSLPMNDAKIIWLENDQVIYSAKAEYYSNQEIQAKEMTHAQEYAEYIRLLYVALTRAEEELIITGNCKKEEISEKTWYSILSSV